ncbi:MAG TPA: 3'-5' exonuclease [Oceanospirillaceae bacterium]|nr:3'-5' exonuclease [Oceanospirillaceae bacterium]
MLRRRLRRARDHWRLRKRDTNSRWLGLFQRYQGAELVSLDIETTSLDVAKASVLSIGAVVIRGNRVLTSEKLSLTIAPPVELPRESVKIHKLRRIDLDAGIPLAQALEQLLLFVGNRPIVGYNIAYDVAVLDRHMRPSLGFGLPNMTLDVMQMYRKKATMSGASEFQLDLSFAAIAGALSVPILGRHTALGDATTTALIYVRMKCV